MRNMISNDAEATDNIEDPALNEYNDDSLHCLGNSCASSLQNFHNSTGNMSFGSTFERNANLILGCLQQEEKSSSHPNLLETSSILNDDEFKESILSPSLLQRSFHEKFIFLNSTGNMSFRSTFEKDANLIFGSVQQETKSSSHPNLLETSILNDDELKEPILSPSLLQRSFHEKFIFHNSTGNMSFRSTFEKDVNLILDTVQHERKSSSYPDLLDSSISNYDDFKDSLFSPSFLQTSFKEKFTAVLPQISTLNSVRLKHAPLEDLNLADVQSINEFTTDKLEKYLENGETLDSPKSPCANNKGIMDTDVMHSTFTAPVDFGKTVLKLNGTFNVKNKLNETFEKVGDGLFVVEGALTNLIDMEEQTLHTLLECTKIPTATAERKCLKGSSMKEPPSQLEQALTNNKESKSESNCEAVVEKTKFPLMQQQQPKALQAEEVIQILHKNKNKNAISTCSAIRGPLKVVPLKGGGSNDSHEKEVTPEHCTAPAISTPIYFKPKKTPLLNSVRSMDGDCRIPSMPSFGSFSTIDSGRCSSGEMVYELGTPDVFRSNRSNELQITSTPAMGGDLLCRRNLYLEGADVPTPISKPHKKCSYEVPKYPLDVETDGEDVVSGELATPN